MTLALWRPRRLRPFVRLSRAQLEAQLEHLRDSRARALGRERATRDWVAAYLDGRAAFFEQEAQHYERLHPVTTSTGAAVVLTAREWRMLAHEIRTCVADFEAGR